MKLNQVNFENFPDSGELVWFTQDISAGGLIADKGWIPAIWLGPADNDHLSLNGHLPFACVLINGQLSNNCRIGRFHRGDSPPDEGDGWK